MRDEKRYPVVVEVNRVEPEVIRVPIRYLLWYPEQFTVGKKKNKQKDKRKWIAM